MCEVSLLGTFLIYSMSAGCFGFLGYFITDKLKQRRQAKKVEVQDA